MSAFLGPIHHLVYNKLAFQNALNQMVIDQYLSEQATLIKNSCGSFVNGKLEEIIDLDNIHQWLSSQLLINELTQAKIIDALGAKQLEEVEALYFQQGQLKAQNASINNVKELFGVINQCFINGMPCDKGLIIDQQSDDSITYRINPSSHPYGDFDTMMRFRNAFIEGLITDTNLQYVVLANNQFILKESTYE